MFLLCLNCPIMGIRPLLQFLHLPRAGPITLTLLFTPYFLYPTRFCMVLFQSSGTPTCCQLMFCKLFCVWSCIPDESTERDVFHVHLLLYHLVLSHITFWITVLAFFRYIPKNGTACLYDSYIFNFLTNLLTVLHCENLLSYRRRRAQQRTRWLDGIIDSVDISMSKLQRWWRTGKPGVLQSMGSQIDGHDRTE